MLIPTTKSQQINKIVGNLNSKNAAGHEKALSNFLNLAVNVVNLHLTNKNNDLPKNFFLDKAKNETIGPRSKNKDLEKPEK